MVQREEEEEEEEEGREEGGKLRRSTKRNARSKSRRNESGRCVFGAWIITLLRHFKTSGLKMGRFCVFSP